MLTQVVSNSTDYGFTKLPQIGLALRKISCQSHYSILCFVRQNYPRVTMYMTKQSTKYLHRSSSFLSVLNHELSNPRFVHSNIRLILLRVAENLLDVCLAGRIEASLHSWALQDAVMPCDNMGKLAQIEISKGCGQVRTCQLASCPFIPS